MTTDILCFIFIWLLPLKANGAVTTGLNHNLTSVTAGGVTQTGFTQRQQTTQQMPVLDLQSETSGLDITPSNVTDVKLQVDVTGTMTPGRFPVNTQTAVTPISSRFHESSSSVGTTAVKYKAISTPTMFPTAEASNPTNPTVPPMVSNPSQTQSTVKILTSPFSPPTQPALTSTVTASTKPEDKSTSARPVTGGDAARSTTTALTSHATKAKKRQESKNGNNYGKIVAGLIGGALLLMMVGFLAIYIHKRRSQKQQIMATDWAGPSPFLSGGQNNRQVTLRSSNRISLSSFLPQRLSKRLSLLPEMDEELQDMTHSTTFEGKHQGNTFGQGVDGKDAQDKNGSLAVTQENSISETDNVPLTNNSEAANLRQDEVEPSNPSGSEENAQAKNE